MKDVFHLINTDVIDSILVRYPVTPPFRSLMRFPQPNPVVAIPVAHILMHTVSLVSRQTSLSVDRSLTFRHPELNKGHLKYMRQLCETLVCQALKIGVPCKDGENCIYQ
jgi:hypothetical protein